MRTHPVTGHQHRAALRSDDYGPLPASFTIKVYEDRDTESDPPFWMAEVEGENFSQMTHGHSVAQAVHMAADLVTMIWDECRPQDAHLVVAPHCYCRDVTHGHMLSPCRGDADDEVGPAVQCCRCGTSVAAKCLEPIDEEP